MFFFAGIIIACVVGLLILLVMIALVVIGIVVAVRKRLITKYNVLDKSMK